MLDFNLIPLIPEIFLSITAMGLLIVGVLNGNHSTKVISWFTCLFFLISALYVSSTTDGVGYTLNGFYRFDSFGDLVKILILFGSIGVMSMSVPVMAKTGMERPEYPVLVMLSVIGMMVMVSSNNFLTLYMGLELQSLALYVLAAFYRHSTRSAEAGAKYFILGALSSGLMLYGITLIYGYAGSIDFKVIEASFFGQQNFATGLIFGLVFILSGLVFKISAAPFHMWTPDVYQGAPLSVTAFFAIVPKLAAIAVIMRLLSGPFASLQAEATQVLSFVAVLSMFVGAIGALAQDNLKRLMAYGSIANMGYVLVGIITGTADGASAAILYMMIYMVSSLGVFTLFTMMQRDGTYYERIRDLEGLSRTNPVMAYCLSGFMFSMAGIPPLAGFFGKFFVFKAAVDAELYTLAVLGVLSSVIAAFYYLRIIKVMFFAETGDGFDQVHCFTSRALLCVSTLFVIGFICTPSWFLDLTSGAVQSLYTS